MIERVQSLIDTRPRSSICEGNIFHLLANNWIVQHSLIGQSVVSYYAARGFCPCINARGKTVQIMDYVVEVSLKSRIVENCALAPVVRPTRDVCRRDAHIYVTRHVTYLRRSCEHRGRSSGTIITSGIDEEIRILARSRPIVNNQRSDKSTESLLFGDGSRAHFL